MQRQNVAVLRKLFCVFVKVKYSVRNLGISSFPKNKLGLKEHWKVSASWRVLRSVVSCNACLSVSITLSCLFPMVRTYHGEKTCKNLPWRGDLFWKIFPDPADGKIKYPKELHLFLEEERHCSLLR